jgi:hypothetical protein
MQLTQTQYETAQRIIALESQWLSSNTQFFTDFLQREYNYSPQMALDISLLAKVLI